MSLAPVFKNVLIFFLDNFVNLRCSNESIATVDIYAHCFTWTVYAWTPTGIGFNGCKFQALSNNQIYGNGGTVERCLTTTPSM